MLERTQQRRWQGFGRSVLAPLAMLLAACFTTAGSNAQAPGNWEDAYFRVPFQHDGRWLAADLFMRVTLRRVDSSFDAFRLAAASTTPHDRALIALIDAVERNDVAAAKTVIYGFGAALSDADYRDGLQRFGQIWANIANPQVRYAIPMVDGVLYVVQGNDAQTGEVVFNTYRVTERADGELGYAVGRPYEEYAALISRIFLAAKERPDLYSEVTQSVVNDAGVEYSMSILPAQEQQRMGISSPFELLFRAQVIDVPFLGDIDPGLKLPAAVRFFREAFEAVASDPLSANLGRYFDAKTVTQTREGAELLATSGGPTMRELLSQRQIRIVIDADPVWVVLHSEKDAPADTRVQDVLYQTDYVIGQATGGFQIAQVFALPILKSLLATPYVQRDALRRISSNEIETVGSAVRRLERVVPTAGQANRINNTTLFGLLGLALLAAAVLWIRAR